MNVVRPISMAGSPVVDELAFELIDPNPFRDLAGNPLPTEQIEKLAVSIASTGYWANTMVRPHPEVAGRYQLAYGHARLEAAKAAGLTSGWFAVRALDDEAMLRIMADENVTQFGKDRFAVYKEATVAAATHIMRKVLTDPEHAGNFTSVDLPAAVRRKLASELTNDIARGESPGRDVIAGFYRGTLDPNNIKAALVVWKETGEMAAWHAQHNPQATKPAEPPKLDPAALRRFDKTDHVRTFVQAVQEARIPPEQQAAVADEVKAALVLPKARSRTGREDAQTTVAREEKFNSQNIRAQVIKQGRARTRSADEKARLERIENMATLDRALLELSLGLTRAANGATQLKNTLVVMGALADTDLTASVRDYAAKAAGKLDELQRTLQHPVFRQSPVLMINQEK